MRGWIAVFALAATASACAHLGDTAPTGHQTVGAGRVAALLDGDGMTGVRADATAAYGGVGIGFSALVDRHRLGDAPALHTAGQIELSMSASLFGLLSTDHRFERYF